MKYLYSLLISLSLLNSACAATNTEMMRYGRQKKQAEPDLVISANVETFKGEVEDYQGIAIVDFYADWCPPCQQMKPVFASLSNEFPHIKFVKVNVDGSQELTKKYTIKMIPSFLFFKNGKVVDRTKGYQGKKDFRRTIYRIIHGHDRG